MNKLKYNINGMHCRSCEIVLEDKIGKVAGVEKVEVNYRRGEAKVLFSGKRPKDFEVERAVREAGYSFGKDAKKPFFSRKGEDYFEVLFAGAIIFALYIFAKIFGFTSFNFNYGESPKLPIVLLIGLTAGVSTCMALIGGIVLSISARHAELHPEATARQKFRPHLFFNLGRVICFAILGGAIGLIGSTFRFSPSLMGALIAIVGGVMIFLGLKLIEIFPRFSAMTLALPKGFSRMLGLHKETKEYSHTQAFLAGGLTFFLPCGFTQAMQIYAVSTGSFVSGALIMAFFALGTAPGLLGIGGVASSVKGWFRSYFFKFAGVLVIIFGLSNISSGMTLTGVTLPSISFSSGDGGGGAVQAFVPEIKDGFQVINMKQLGNKYEPNQFIIKKGVPVKWVVEGTTMFSCSRILTVPELKIYQDLKQGENVITFTPEKAGKLRFSCGMGMFSGYFDVVD